MSLKLPGKAVLAALTFALGCSGTIGVDEGTATQSDGLVLSGAVGTPKIIAPPISRPRRPVPLTLRGCDNKRLIGRVPAGAKPVCPTATGSWSGAPLFSNSKVTDGSRNIFCRYDFKGAADKYTLDGLPNHPRGSLPGNWLEADCPAVVALGDSKAEQALRSIEPIYRAAYREQIGYSPQLPHLVGTTGVMRPVRTKVSVLDSAPNGTVNVENDGDPHGRLIGALINDLSCTSADAPGCASDIQSVQMLATDSEDPSTPPRPFAWISDVGPMIQEVVDRRGGKNLILNLSIGYDPRFATLQTSDDVAAWHEATASLMAGLHHAACSGALVIAAAGNSSDGPMLEETENQPMFPGSLTQQSTMGCGAPKPLAYAAGGVMPDDAPLVNERPNSRPELVAPAYMVTYPTNNVAVTPVGLQTGTSFGAAGVSAAAAIIWGYLPQLDAKAVIERVRSAAVELSDLSTNLCPGGAPSCGKARRVSICATIKQALSELCASPEYANTCALNPPTLSCSTPAAHTGRLVNVNPIKMVSLADRLTVEYTPIDGTACPGTDIQGADTVLATASAVSTEFMCANENFANGLDEPFTLGPQPGSDGCRSCGILRYASFVAGNNSTLFVGLKPGYELTAVNGVTLSDSVGVYHAFGDELKGAWNDGLIAIPLDGVITGSTAVLSYRQTDSDVSFSSHIPIWDAAGGIPAP